ncbi:NAD(P)H-dependent flavin oxidoreductase [Streptomyces sp. NPDC014734]|uniref:NAD(P)H-dependent flavin oxidoreductase n=1 Tax=Streptomyces sp. NPDC014734 TaxID=3364886 RepID=UPI003701F8C8
MSAPEPAGTAGAAGPVAAVARGAAALGVGFPLVQAGMGGVAGPALAAAVSDAGALGTVALYKSDRALATALVQDTAARTDRTFGVNVIPEVAGRLLVEQLAVVLARADRRLTLNSYGLPPRSAAEAVIRAGHRLLVQVGGVREARAAAELGAHAVALQGTRAGGHHLGDEDLADLLAHHGLDVPVLAAGAIATGADLLAAVRAGAAGALCGTLFVAAEESAAHPAYKRDLIGAGASDTVVTDRFSIGWPGRPHRVLRGPVTDAPGPPPSSMIAWTTVMGTRRPVPRGSAAAPTAEAEGRVGEMARYAGCGCAATTAVEPAAVIVARLRSQFAAAVTAGGTATGQEAATTTGSTATAGEAARTAGVSATAADGAAR